MKKLISIIVFLCLTVLLSCSKQHSIDPGLQGDTGSLQISVNMGKIGELRKAAKTTTIEMTKLYIALSADGQSSIFDTLQLTGGNQERTERKTYTGLVAWVDGQMVDWTLHAEALDQNGHVIHSGDTTFRVQPLGTIEIPLFLNAQYSMLIANYFPIRDSVTRCVLDIDGYGFEADSSFPKQSYIGDTITLSYDYMIASPSGIPHHIDLNVYGQLMGIDALLYSGDTTIIVKSGKDENYQVILDYVGPNKLYGAATMIVSLGKIGKVTVNGILSRSDVITFQKTYGGSEIENGGSVQQTSDGGYIITGTTYSYGAGWNDVYLIKTDANGDTVWTRTFGGAERDGGSSVQQTKDRGYIIVGYTYSFGEGDRDVYLIKTNAKGNIIWTRTFGGIGIDNGNIVRQTKDGGYIITGETTSNSAGYEDVYLIKTDANGNMIWTRTFGGNSIDYGSSMQQTSDEGYVIVGTTYSFGAGERDIYLIKTNTDGDTLWTRTIGGIGGDIGSSIQQTSDGGYIITGVTWSFGNTDVYLVKTDLNGDVIWTRTFGGSVADCGTSVVISGDGGYIIAGVTQSFGGVYLIKTNANGDTVWTRVFKNFSPLCYSAQQTNDGGYIIGGWTPTLDADYNIYLIKTDENGKVK